MFAKLKELLTFVKDIYASRKMILELSKNDFKVKYAGSYLGIIWGFIQPFITIAIYWFVFQVGFRTSNVQNGTPYIVWLICGLIPWFFFSEALTNATNSLSEYSYLVKKIVFRVSVLPFVKIVSALFIHLFFVFFLLVVFLIYGYDPSFMWIQCLYYSFCMIFLLVGITWITSSLMPFFKDIGQIVIIITQIGFWLTPIVWSYTILPERLRTIFKLNPFYYISEGYRDTFINNVGFWNRYNQTAYFWGVSIIIFIAGAFIFKKLKPHFSDVL